MDAQLQIRHIGYQDDKPQFDVLRIGDGKHSTPVVLTPPEQTTVAGRPNSNLQQDLRWYLEQFLELPLGAYLDTAERIQASLQAWGSTCFDALFQKQARDWLQDARRHGLENLTLKIASNDPRVLAWPWEALHDPEGGTLAHHCRIERQLSELHDPLPLPANLPDERINILLVIARPYADNDVGFHALSRPLVELTKGQNSPVHIDVLRPPTFDQLRQTLRDKPGFYHIVHFDGHGGYGTPGHTSPHAFKGLQGMLVFEDGNAQPAEVEASVLSQLLAEHRIPIMVLNACQSAKIDERADDAFASVAAALLKAGIRSVVAMGYNLYVSGAQQFVPAFYQRLLNSGNVAEAARAGRQAMLAHPERVCVLGEHALQDWLVPVLYQQMQVGEAVLPVKKIPSVSPFAKGSTLQMGSVDAGEGVELPEAAQDLGDYGFIGRERAVQALERARLQQPQAAFLIHGMAGIGKTTLAKGFLHWLYDTNGLARDLPNGGVFWFSFDEIRSTEYVVNEMLDPLFGTNARAAPLPQKLQALTQALREHPFLLVWDNFESASGIAGTDVTALLPEDDRKLLKDLLKRLRGGKTKVLITSRSPENWLTPPECFRLPLSGLQGEELWEYCNAVVHDLGLKIDRKQEDFQQLITELDGNPLAIRAILLRLPERTASNLLAELKQQFAGQMGDDSTRRIGAALSLFDQSLPKSFAPILQLIGLHERYVEPRHIEYMLKEVNDISTLSHISPCFATLESAGFLHRIDENIYRMHPVLHGYLSRQYFATEMQQRVFVDFMGLFADAYVTKELHEQRVPFSLHGVNFRHALVLAQTLGMEQDIVALTNSLGIYAQNICDYIDSSQLFEGIATYHKQHNNHKSEAGAYHQLGVIAEKQHDLSVAEHYYKQSLMANEKCDNARGAAQTYHQLGRIAQERWDYAAAGRWYQQSLVLEKKNNNEQGMSISYLQMGVMALEQRDYKVAEHYCRQALAIHEKYNDECGAVNTYHNLGVIALAKLDFVIAERWLKRALEIIVRFELEDKSAATFTQLGILANAQRDYTIAESWYKQSLAIEEKYGDKHGAAFTYHQLGRTALEQQDYVAAEGWFRQSLEIREKLGDKNNALPTYNQLGRVAHFQQNYQGAAEWYLKALLILQDYDNHPDFMTLAGNYVLVVQASNSSIQTVLRQRWKEAGLDQIITLGQLEQKLNDNANPTNPANPSPKQSRLSRLRQRLGF